jgi:D-alanine-D-alanine ligase
MRVAVIFGGRSAEHQVSIVSARFVSSQLEAGGHEILPMAIDTAGRWADPAASARVLADSGDRTDDVVSFQGTESLDRRLLDGQIDTVFPVLHGPYGEDGTLQGLCEILSLPYVGCGVTASAVAMDKILSKRLLREAGLQTPAWVEVDAEKWRDRRDATRGRCLELPLPLFVKPANLGSSVGISRVDDARSLDRAVDTALRFDRRVVVEVGLDAREIEIAVLGNREPAASIPGEVVSGHAFYDYADKYLDDDCELLAPAPLDERLTKAVRELAVRVFQTLGCEGMARVDLFLNRSSGDLWVNEVNTIPGFTSISMYPRLWALSGKPGPQLVDDLVRLARERHVERGERALTPDLGDAASRC